MANKSKSNKKIKIDASFEELVKLSVGDNPKPKGNISPDKKIKALKIVHKHLSKKSKKD